MSCRFSCDEGQIGSRDIAQLVMSLGEVGFSDRMLEGLNRVLEVNHLSLVHLETDEKVTFVLSASDDTLHIAREMQQLYLTIYYRQDPNKDFLQHSSQGSHVVVSRLKQKDINDVGYRRLWYEKMGIVDRLSVLARADKGLYCLNLFRNKTPFPDESITLLEPLAELLASLVIKHSRMSGALSGFMTREAQIKTLTERLAKVDPSLSRREKEVCARILLGMSSDGIALDLGVKLQSILTYRKRAYSRLNISSQNELFARCLTVS